MNCFPEYSIGERQSQFSHSLDPATSSPACCKLQGTTQQTSDRVSFPMLKFLGLAHKQPTPNPRSYHFYSAIRPDLLCCPGKVQDMLSYSHALCQGQLFHLPVERAKWKGSLSLQYHHTADNRQGQLAHTHVLGAGSPTSSPHPGSSQLCCPGEVQGLLSQGRPATGEWRGQVSHSDDIRVSSPLAIGGKGQEVRISSLPMSLHSRRACESSSPLFTPLGPAYPCPYRHDQLYCAA